MSAFIRPKSRAAGPSPRAEVEQIIAEAQQRVADFWEGTGTDYETAAAAFNDAMRAEATDAAYCSLEAS